MWTGYRLPAFEGKKFYRDRVSYKRSQHAKFWENSDRFERYRKKTFFESSITLLPLFSDTNENRNSLSAFTSFPNWSTISQQSSLKNVLLFKWLLGPDLLGKLCWNAFKLRSSCKTCVDQVNRSCFQIFCHWINWSTSSYSEWLVSVTHFNFLLNSLSNIVFRWALPGFVTTFK